MELGAERTDLLHQPVHQPLAGDDRQARNVVDRLLRIKLGALAARPVEDVDEVAFEVEEAELEDREQAAGPGSDDDDIRFMVVRGHDRSRIARQGPVHPWRSGTVTTSPSSASLTRI